MPRGHLRLARGRSGECHAVDRSPCRRRGLDCGAEQGDLRTLRLSCAVALTLATAATVHTGLDVSGKSHLGVFWAKGTEQKGTLFERWNTYSRVRVTSVRRDTPFGWGLAHMPETKIDQNYLDIDADAGTVITRFDGDLGKLSYLKDDVINAAYLVQPPASRGRRRGRRTRHSFRALLRRQAHQRNRDQSRDLRSPDRQVRRFLRPSRSSCRSFAGQCRSPQLHQPFDGRYDLVQISLIDTWAATAAGGLTLTENRLYTVEAWEDFYRALNPGGCCRYRAGSIRRHRGEFYRLVAIAGARCSAMA